MKEVYGESNLCRICNIKQILTYAKMKVQPVWIDEGYGGRLIAYYFIPEGYFNVIDNLLLHDVEVIVRLYIKYF